MSLGRPGHWYAATSIEDMVVSLEARKLTLSQQGRRSPRFPFIAVAEITDAASGQQLEARVAMLSLHGCFVEMQNTLPAESSVGIKIFAESEYFDGPAKIVYVCENVGMGLAFQEVSLRNGNVVREWLSRASESMH
jgi:hypothetical protein